jgi:N-acetylglucosamine-6-sulfatase
MEASRQRAWQGRLALIVMLAVAAAAACVLALMWWKAPATSAQTVPAKPNFVFIITDDMRKDDLTREYMPNTHNLIASQGMTFNNAYVPLASCCPTRASVLRGQYVHNHRVWHSTPNGPDSGWEGWNVQGRENDNLATHLQGGGYRTGLFGKYFNGYKSTGKPPLGWSDFFAKNLGSGYFNYSVNDNGVTRSYGSAPGDYFTDVISKESQEFIEQSVNQGKPFFLYVAPNAPHEPSTPAPRHVNSFNGEPAPRLDSYNEATVSDKPPWLSSLPTISSTEAAAIQRRHEDRVESLQAVDEMVGALVNKLSDPDGPGTAREQLTNTYIVFTSDNGWQHGEHRIAKHKERPYEESSHMPLLIRGPGVAAGSTADSLVTFPDFMPTFLELGGIAIPDYVDGTSLVPLLNGTVNDKDTVTDDWRNAILLEGHDPGSPERDYFAIRTAAGLKYIEYRSGFKEFYNLASDSDPFEMNSNPSSAPAALVDRLQRLKTCAAATCRAIEREGSGSTSPPPEPPPPSTDCTITGTTNAETISGTSGDNVICGGGGNDTIQGLAGNDTLRGEGGNDTLLGGVGDDTLDGGLGTDTASYSASLTAVIASLATNSSTGEGSDTFLGVENLLGSSKVDTLTGSATNNKLTGGGGADTEHGGLGDDQVIGSGGADSLFGEDGNDTVNSKDGVNGNDSLDGGAGTDTKTTDATEKSIVGFP